MLAPTDEIKSRLDIVELIQGYIRVHKAGINFKANCPFHSEKTPSFFISPSRQIWHCFGCGKGGDIFKFVMEIEGQEFPEALKMLAERAGVKLKREDPLIRSERNRLYDINEEAAKIFEKNLSLTSAVKTYLEGRGVAEKTVSDFHIGFAPQSWDFLLKTLVAKGFRRDDIVAAGLALKSQDGSSVYDRFRSRIMFPIADGSGRVVGFSGRIFADPNRKPDAKEAAEAKYINSPQTLIYDKSRILYGFDKAKQEIRTKDQVVIVEGQMDCVMSHQAGVKNTVAVSGTAATSQQLNKQLKALCNSIVFTFDEDDAGESATSRALTVAAAEFFDDRYVAIVPKGKDVADVVSEDPQLWGDSVKNPQPFMEYFMNRAFKKFGITTLDGRKNILNRILPELARVRNPVLVSRWTKVLAEKLDTKEEAIWGNLRGIRNPDLTERYNAALKESFAPRGRRELLEERLLTLLPMVAEDVKARELANHHLAFILPVHQALFAALQPGTGPVALTADLQRELDLLRFKSEVIMQLITNPEEEFMVCKKELERHSIKERLLELGQQIQRSEKEKNDTVLQPLLQDFQLLSAKLKGIS